MNYTKETLEKNRVKFAVEASTEEWQAAIEEVYNKTKNKFNVEGFRKGKAPRRVIESVYGTGVFFEDAMDIILQKTYGEILDKESELEPVDSPEIDIVAVSDSTFKYTATVQLKPDVKLGAYTGLKLTKEVKKVTDEDVKSEIDKELENAGRWEPVADRAIQNGDKTLIDYSGSVDGVKFEGGTAEKQNLVIGSNTFIPGFEEQMVGMAIGETKDIMVTFPEEYHEKSLAGKEAVFTVTVHEATTKVVPALDDETVKDISSCDTVDEYKKSVADRIKDRYEEQADIELENKILDTVADASEVEIPQCMIDNESRHKIEQFAQQLSYQGLNINDYFKYTGRTEEDLMKDYAESSKKSVKYRLVMQEIVKAIPPIVVSDEEILDYIKTETNGQFTASKIDEMPAEYADYARSVITTKKVFEYLKVNNEITVSEK